MVGTRGNFFGNFACQGGKLVHCARKFSIFNRLEGVGDPVRSDNGNLLQLPRTLNDFYDAKGHRVIVAVKTNQIGIALQDVGRGVVSLLSIPVPQEDSQRL